MIIIIALVILIAAVVTGVAGVLSNSGDGHGIIHHFAVFGYHVTGLAGALFLYGVAVGALAMFGLSPLLAGARRTSRRGREARRGLTQSHRETVVVSQERDDLLQQRETARAHTASTLSNDFAANGGGADREAGSGGGPHRKWHLSAPRTASVGQGPARGRGQRACPPGIRLIQLLPDTG
ncbi:MAG: hypothetical protein M3Z75_19660 [Actinomycetota bacterium]|nr:hypothetical protein [Actinomycetota bacterium]